jgi:hypothetical protein
MKTLPTIVMLFAASMAFAVMLVPFTNWDDLTKQSPDIVIARCVVTADTTIIDDGMNWTDIEVLSVLKGDTKPGPARMVSTYWPRQGENFLMFSTYHTNQKYRGYNATEMYRIVPLGLYFNTNAVTGKRLDEQIQIVLRRRLEKLNGELKDGAEEKKRLEEGIKK